MAARKQVDLTLTLLVAVLLSLALPGSAAAPASSTTSKFLRHRVTSLVPSPIGSSAASLRGNGKSLTKKSSRSTTYAPVDVYVCPFDACGSKGLANHPVFIIEANSTYTTNGAGMLYLEVPVFGNITLVSLAGNGYHRTQASTVQVPPVGLVTTLTQLVVQVPSDVIYDLFFAVTPGHKSEAKCQIVVTVCNVNVTIKSMPQGLLGSTVALDPPLDSKIFYFGTWGKFSNDTNPLPNDLNSTSWDGGVLIENVPVNVRSPYVITAQHPGYIFSSTTFWCLAAGTFINAGPNMGPRAVPASRSNNSEV